MAIMGQIKLREIRIKIFLLILFMIACHSLVFADNSKIIACKDFHTFLPIKQQVRILDKKFQWNSQDCQIVTTQSIFPRKNKEGNIQFQKGLEIFIYQNNKLKFICLPGWLCKTW